MPELRELKEKPESETVIEASWAPQDPRDRLYDKAASSREKRFSLFRIFAAFHPVLNVPVLFYDSFRRLGFLRGMLLWTALLVILVSFVWFFAE